MLPYDSPEVKLCKLELPDDPPSVSSKVEVVDQKLNSHSQYNEILCVLKNSENYLISNLNLNFDDFKSKIILWGNSVCSGFGIDELDAEILIKKSTVWKLYLCDSSFSDGNCIFVLISAYYSLEIQDIPFSLSMDLVKKILENIQFDTVEFLSILVLFLLDPGKFTIELFSLF